MIELVNFAITKLHEASLEYADIRITDITQEIIATRNREVINLECGIEKGAGIRVLIDGAWGYCSVHTLDEESITGAIETAITISRRSKSRSGNGVRLIPQQPITASYTSEYQIHPRDVGQDEKIHLLYTLNKTMTKRKDVVLGESTVVGMDITKYFGNTEGSRIDQHFIVAGYTLKATAIRGSEVQFRTDGGGLGTVKKTGYEIIDAKQLSEESERIAADAQVLLDAPVCPDTRADLILMPDQMLLQIHESIGHACELDRIYNAEISYAGGSFVKPDMLNAFRYAAPIVNVTSDSTTAESLGTIGYDDDGVPAKKVYLIKDGILRGVISNRESAYYAGLSQSSGNSIAESYKRFPLVRMTSVNLEPGDSTLDAMIADTEYGFIFEANKSYSIDDLRLKFQFGCEIAHEIKNGKKGKVYKNPNYNGITPQFWNSCVAIGSEEEQQLYCAPNCGKGQPGQMGLVGHASPPAKFTGVHIFGV